MVDLRVVLLSDKMREIGFRLVDLAEFLDISRPTAYKFIDIYETGQRDKLDPKIVRLFEFIEKSESKISVINYIIKHIAKSKDMQTRKAQIASLLKKESATKVDFIELLSVSEIYDPILSYLLSCAKLATKVNLTQKDEAFLVPLNAFYNALNLKFNTKDKK